MNAREKIFAQIRASLQRGKLSPEQEKGLSVKMQNPTHSILPARANLTGEALINLFIEQAKYALAHLERVDSLSRVPQLILQILQEQALPFVLRAASDSVITSLPWQDFPELTVSYGRAFEADKVSLTPCLCGVAETGTLVLLSSHNSPTTLNFLPALHIALLDRKSIVRYYEEAWDLIRTRDLLPRMVNFITGPSRTADIEQTVQIGVHGPKQVFIILY